MHYCLMLFTKEFPAKEKIDSLMKKYAWENNHSEKHDKYPQFTYDWYEIGGRYNGSIKLKVDFKDENIVGSITRTIREMGGCFGLIF